MFAPIILVLAITAFSFVNADLYVINPSSGGTCHGGEKCTIQFLDSGVSPLLSDIGVTRVALYHGEQEIVQTIATIDVSQSHSVTFVPNPKAGPTSATYYIAFTSTKLKNKDGAPYVAFSPFFKLDRMSGSFNDPLPSATSQKPIPSSLSTPSSPTTLSTRTIRNPNTSSVPTPTAIISFPDNSSFSTSRILSTSASNPPPTSSAPIPTASIPRASQAANSNGSLSSTVTLSRTVLLIAGLSLVSALL